MWILQFLKTRYLSWVRFDSFVDWEDKALKARFGVISGIHKDELIIRSNLINLEICKIVIMFNIRVFDSPKTTYTPISRTHF